MSATSCQKEANKHSVAKAMLILNYTTLAVINGTQTQAK
jgi:hypothetical protein